MKYLITIIDSEGTRVCSGVCDIGLLVDAEYDAGALGITSMVMP